jgi:peptidoglycan/LPS O-acetylase OafA/YrhL
MKELDSLRGIAALTVVFNHFLIILPTFYSPQKGVDNLEYVLKYTPFHIFWAGHEAVIFFFILSGFVLSIPFLKNTKRDYTSFLIKRISRIYIPYLIAIFIAVLVSINVSIGQINGYSNWALSSWGKEINFSTILNHIILIGNYDNYIYNPVIWSLIHEMRISIIFPLIMLIVIKFEWKTNVMVAFCITILGYILHKITNTYLTHNDFFITLHYVAMFIIGALISKHLVQLKGLYVRTNNKLKFFIIIGATLTYTFNWWFFPSVNVFRTFPVADWSTAIGVAIFIVFALSSTRISNVLFKKPFVFLGNISYSLYLYHSIVLLSFVSIFHSILPVYIIMLLAFGTSVIVGYLSYVFVEVPSINLFKKKNPVDSLKKVS